MMSADNDDNTINGDNTINRREFLHTCFRAGALLAIRGVSGIVAGRSIFAGEVWQIDPHLCKQCGRCATECVITPSAVKCVHVYAICGYCDLCSGYFRQGTLTLNTGAENQLCPTSALVRKYIEEPYYQYVVDETKCIGCGQCVKGCSLSEMVLCTCRSGTTDASTVMIAQLRGYVRRRLTRECLQLNPIC